MKMTGKLEATPYTVDRAERMIKIIGKGSATARALRELRERRDAGESVSLFVVGSYIFVGPIDTGSVT